MPHFPPRLPLGRYDDESTPDTLGVIGAGQRPAPVGLAVGDVSDAEMLAARECAGTGAGELEAAFTLTPHSYRVLSPREGWQGDQRDSRLEPADARRVLEAAVRSLHNRSELAAILRHAAVHLKGLAEGGRFIVVRQHLLALPTAPYRASAATSASPLPYAETTTTPPPPDDDGFSPLLAAEQAATLRMAAQFGVPFCEECSRLAS